MRLDVGVRVLSMGGLISSVFAMPTGRLGTRPFSGSLLDEISQSPNSFLVNAKFVLDDANFASLNSYVALGNSLPATENDFNAKYDKEKFYNSMRDVILRHGDFYAMTRDAYVSIHTHTKFYHDSTVQKFVEYGTRVTQYAEVARIIYSLIAKTLDEMEGLVAGTPERHEKLQMLKQLLDGIISATLAMSQNSTGMHNGLVSFQAGTINDSGLINASSGRLFAAQTDIDATFGGMKSDLDAAEKKVNDLQIKMDRGDKSETTYWDHYNAVVDSMAKASAWAICWDTIDDLKAITAQSSQILRFINGTLAQLSVAIEGFARISAAFSNMRSQFVAATGDVDPMANPRFFSEVIFRDTLNSAAADWLLVSALFEVATLEHFLLPPIQYETVENPYACNDVPPTESGVISYFLIRKTDVHPQVIAFYKSNDLFSTACTEANLVSIVSYYAEANTQQVIIPTDGYITHWKALSTISPEWQLYTERNVKPGQRLIRWMLRPDTVNTWMNIDDSVGIQDYDYDWEDIENRRRTFWEGYDLYPIEEDSEDSYDIDGSGGNGSDSYGSPSNSDPNDFESVDDNANIYSGDNAREENQVEKGQNLYDIVVESAPPRGLMEEEVEPRPQTRASSNTNTNHRRGSNTSQQIPEIGHFQRLAFDRQGEIRGDVRRARQRNRAMQREKMYIPLGLLERRRPRDELVRLGYYIDPVAEGIAEAERRAASEQRPAGDSGLPRNNNLQLIEEEQIPVNPVQPQTEDPSAGDIPQINTGPEPTPTTTYSFLGQQAGGYTGDVDEFFDFR
ncbi:hypothetical protein TWF281_004371 [Arthrobotrys megalospora]